jgi:glycosyltransferase involved in cell wall biosynthesis
MTVSIGYDLTRLASRLLNDTPNGIDRVDMALARYFFGPKQMASSGLVYLGPLGYRVVSRAAAIEIIGEIDTHFGEARDPESDEAFRQVRAWLLQNEAGKSAGTQRVRERRRILRANVLRWIGRHGLSSRQAAERALPEGACYINTSQFPLSFMSPFDWLARRPDVKPVFFIHDMLPFEHPEYFRRREFGRHERRIANVAKHAAGVIVSTQVVKEALQRALAPLGRAGLPVLVAPLPVPPVFLDDEPVDRDLAAVPFFVQCGTLEPRKNHLMILHVWRELVARHGAAAPKLVLIGTRGWENENIIDLLERCVALRGHVIEASGLTTPSLKRLMRNARALLMPSFAEGFGLPLAEAIALGTPAIGANIPVFHEIAGSAFTPLSPIDGEGWLRAVEAAMEQDVRMESRPKTELVTSPEAFFGAVEAFVDSL